jgi:pimeloyl-ACP methyl ester carboxylesterase
MATKLTPVVFIHGLWLHSSSWKKWVELFNEAGYESMAPGWPGDSRTVAETRKRPEQVANHGIAEVTEHYADMIRTLSTKPIVIGHSFGGLIAQKLLGEGLAAAAIAIDPAQPKGILPLPFVQLQNAFPVLSHLSQIKGANMPTKEQFRKSFGNALTKQESDQLYDTYVIPSPGKPLFQAAVANLVSNSEAKVDFDAARGPLLITGSEQDRTVPESTTRNNFNLYSKATTVNDYMVFDRSHSLTIDSGWREIADYSLEWLKKQSL